MHVCVPFGTVRTSDTDVRVDVGAPDDARHSGRLLLIHCVLIRDVSGVHPRDPIVEDVLRRCGVRVPARHPAV